MTAGPASGHADHTNPDYSRGFELRVDVRAASALLIVADQAVKRLCQRMLGDVVCPVQCACAGA